MTEDAPRRIVSLLPSATEIVCALGLKDQLVGRSHECDFPGGLENLPVCTRANIDSSASSRSIDDQVKQHLSDALSIYDIVSDALRKARPDVIVTQDQCDVCAVALPDVERAVAVHIDASVRVISLAPQTLTGALGTILTCGEAFGCIETATAVYNALLTRLDTLRSMNTGKPRTTVACIEWSDPLMAAGNWVPEMVEIAGGNDVFGHNGQHSPWITFDALQEKDPDVIIFMPCGFGLERSADDAHVCLSTPGWQHLSAFQNERVYAVDGNSYFNRPGPRLVESIEILSELLFPNEGTKHRDTGWRRLIGHG